MVLGNELIHFYAEFDKDASLPFPILICYRHRTGIMTYHPELCQYLHPHRRYHHQDNIPTMFSCPYNQSQTATSGIRIGMCGTKQKSIPIEIN